MHRGPKRVIAAGGRRGASPPPAPPPPQPPAPAQYPGGRRLSPKCTNAVIFSLLLLSQTMCTTSASATLPHSPHKSSKMNG